MFSFFQNALGALIGVFFALLLASSVGDNFSEKAPASPEKTGASIEEILPPETIAYLKEGMEETALKEIPTEAEPPAKEESVPEENTLPVETPPPAPPSPPEKPPAEEPPALSALELNAGGREATVNIFCTLNGGIDALSGSGVIIDERGIVLTNAHIAQYFLLDTRRGEEFVLCTIRAGSPAKPAWKGELLYLPSLWFDTHADEINEENRVDTGEHDFALVRITDAIGNASSSFPALRPAYDGAGIVRGESVLVASYPAGFLDAEAIYKNLWQISSITVIKEIYNFASSTRSVIDVFSVPGVIGAQEGSSGGAVIRGRDGRLLGLATTRSRGDTTGERDLFALSLPYINADVETDLEKSLEEFLSSDLLAYQKWFNQTVLPRMKERLLRAVEEN